MESVEFIRKQLEEKYALCMGEHSLAQLAKLIGRTAAASVVAGGRSLKTGKKKTMRIAVKHLMPPERT